MTPSRIPGLFLIIAVCLFGARCWGENSADVGPATSTVPSPSSQAVVIQGEITGVEGKVQVRDNGDQNWKAAAVGMKVSEGAEFRTGPRSAVRVLIPPDQTITLDRLGVMKLLTAIQNGNLV